jgi:uncharacterized protein YndB with AHSA1/START domain
MYASRFVYVTYIRTTPERLWKALTDGDFMEQYWFGTRLESEWRAGAPWRMIMADGRIGDAGEIEICEPPLRLRMSWRNEWSPELHAEGFSTCTIELEPVDDTVKLTLVHEIDRADSKLIGAVSGGWPKILSNLKSLIETGAVVLARNPGAKAA